MKRLIFATALILALAEAGAYAGDEAVKPQPQATNKRSEQFVHKGAGVVKRVDASDRIVTLDHGPIPSLNWPAMTMPFSVRDNGLLWTLQPGASVAFEFVQEGNRYVLTGAQRSASPEAMPAASAQYEGPYIGSMQGMRGMGEMQAMRDRCMGMMGKMMSK